MKKPGYSVAVLPFVLFHVAALACAVAATFSWGYAALIAVVYLLGMFGITAGYHRYFSHRAYRTSRPFQFLLALLGTLTVQKGVLWWAANHRHHHRFSDEPEDIHSPRQGGFMWSHMGWLLSHRFDKTQWAHIKDFAKYPELVWLNKYFLVPPTIMGFTFFFAGGLDLLTWGFLVPIVLLWHGTFCINSLTHMFGRRRYSTTDDSRNSLVLALITLGEGWHNNHHHYAHSAQQGFFWWEIDLSYYALRMLSAVGLVWDLRDVPRWAKEGRARRHERPARTVERPTPEPEKLAA